MKDYYGHVEFFSISYSQVCQAVLTSQNQSKQHALHSVHILHVPINHNHILFKR